MTPTWSNCIDQLKDRISASDISVWLAPLHPVERDNTLKLLAPNRYVRDYVKKNFLIPIENTVQEMNNGIALVQVEIGGHGAGFATADGNGAAYGTDDAAAGNGAKAHNHAPSTHYAGGAMNADHTFAKHVEGNSNQLARAAALQVGKRPGQSYNPLFIYGGVGLGKTHLMQAAGHLMLQNEPRAKVLYVSSERFVNDMVNALKNGTIDKFKQHYRSPAALLVDDIQFLGKGKKESSQEEFFHTFNTLLDGQRQVVITSDHAPNALSGLEQRLISRFDGGLTVGIDPPELETRVAILKKKALEQNFTLPNDVAFFVAGVERTHVRALESALNSITATARFTGNPIDMALARQVLRDKLAHQQQQLSVENIQQTVAEYYKLRVAALLSKSRTRAIARPRQMAMFLTKEYTALSLPQIGDHFGGRDHSTVIHACVKISELLKSDAKIKEDYRNLQRLFGA